MPLSPDQVVFAMYLCVFFALFALAIGVMELAKLLWGAIAEGRRHHG